MKAVKWKNEWLQLVILAAPFCAAALFWHRLPAQIPIHWNIHNKVDGYAGKTFGALFLPVINVASALLLVVLPLIDPKIRKSQSDVQASLGSVMRILRLAITGFLAVVSIVVLAAGLGMRVDVGEIISAGLALLLIVVGNFLGKLRPNYFTGIRTPWTLESPTVWTKTHRLGGFVTVVGGICMLLLCFLVPSEVYMLWVMTPCVVLIAGIPIIYSYVAYQKEKKTRSA